MLNTNQINIKNAVNLILEMHKDQKYGNSPYIKHLFGVAGQMNTEKEITVALMHDILEDTNMTAVNLSNYFTEDIIEAVKLLSKAENGVIKFKTYNDFIQNLANSKNRIAIKVKIADLKYNLANNPKPSQIKKYKKALEMLKK
jgi:(p)ppGpp synthase/HD superfamily hydrolase